MDFIWGSFIDSQEVPAVPLPAAPAVPRATRISEQREAREVRFFFPTIRGVIVG